MNRSMQDFDTTYVQPHSHLLPPWPRWPVAAEVAGKTTTMAGNHETIELFLTTGTKHVCIQNQPTWKVFKADNSQKKGALTLSLKLEGEGASCFFSLTGDFSQKSNSSKVGCHRSYTLARKKARGRRGKCVPEVKGETVADRR